MASAILDLAKHCTIQHVVAVIEPDASLTIALKLQNPSEAWAAPTLSLKKLEPGGVHFFYATVEEEWEDEVEAERLKGT